MHRLSGKGGNFSRNEIEKNSVHKSVADYLLFAWLQVPNNIVKSAE